MGAVAITAVLGAMLAWEGVAAPTANGRVVYSNNTTTPQYRAYTASTNAFAAPAGTVTGAAQTWIVDKAAPTRGEHIAGYISGTTLYILRWNGSAWSAEWNLTVGSDTGAARRFDIAYETSSGDAIVVYSKNATTNEMGYRVWNGTVWTVESRLNSNRTTGVVRSIKLASHPTTDQIALAFGDANRDLSAFIWTGTAWGNEPSAVIATDLSSSTNAGDYDTFDLAYESLSGDLIIVWGSETGNQDATYITFSGGWGTATQVSNLGRIPAQVSLAASASSNDVLLAFSVDGGSTRLYGTRWTGTAWSTPTRLDNIGGNPVASAINRRHFSTGWLESGSLKVGIVPYSTSAATNTVTWYYFDSSTSTWALAAAWTPGGTAIAAEQWSALDVDPAGLDTGMLTFSDSANDLWAKRVVLSAGPTFTWSNSDAGAALTNALASTTTQNFDFAYDRFSGSLTVGDGTNPSNASLCPGATATMLDAFTLQTSSGTDTVTGVTVTLAAGTSVGISLVEITNDAGGTVYGSAANPGSDTVAITLGTNISATTTSTQYKVRITPKTALNMAAPSGASYAVTGTVTAVTSTLSKSYADTGSSTVTIDNLSPSNPSWGTVTPGNGQIVLNWTNPGDADFNQVVILRSTATITDAPVEGATYVAGNTIGASTVRYVGNLQTFTDTGLTNGTGYLYKIFARDTCINYSVGVETGPHTPSAPVPALTTGAPSAVVDACNQITVTAPFTGDTDADSSTLFRRSPSATGPWTTACAGVTGASPRLCVDTGVVASGTYYYEIDFTDPDGVLGTDPRVIGPFNTPASCIANNTTAGTVNAEISSCRQITVTAPFTGDGNLNGSIKVEYNTTNTWPGTTACASVTGTSPRQCLVTGLSPSTSYYVRTTFSDADGVAGTNPQVLGPLALPACAADQVAPMAMILSPARNAVVGGTDRFKVQIWDEGGLAASNPVQWSIDSGAFSAVVTLNGTYTCGTGCSVYEFDVNTTALLNGSHYVNVRVTDLAANIARTSWGFRVNNSAGAPAGAGTLLRRTTSSQLCQDCHAIKTHSSQSTSTRYGNWSVDCMTCHTPHETANVYLVRPTIQTPNSGATSIQFRTSDRAGSTNPQYAHLGDYSGASNTPYTDGICETCHTKTNHYRNDASGGDHTHNASTRCVGCHAHGDGFAAGESKGGYRCSDCHPAIWQGMTGGVAKTSKHTLGAVAGTNDSFTDSAVTYGSPLDAVTAANRKCVSCHQDHIHNNPGSSTHDYNVHKDATSLASRAVTRDGAGNIVTGTPARTDFDATDLTNGGMCLSCHKNGVSATRPVIDRSAFDASAHDYTNFSTYGAWSFDLHDGSKFDRNCTKCHSDRGDAQPAATTAPFGSVHFSDYPMLLAGSKNPAGTPATFVCYNCHGNGTTGVNLSGKNIATTMAKTRNHTSNSDSVHDSVAEFSGAAFGNTLGGKPRHASCLDCHDTHEARSGLHTPQSNLAGPSLQGAWGAQLSTNPARWVAPASTNFTKKVIVAGTDVEATLCFKCHSAYWGTLPTTPSGTFQETDQAREFNPNNASSGATAGGFHPVLASAGTNLGATSNIIAPWTRTSLMTCSDCHASDTTTDPAGPHGSAAGFMLKGPNTTWSATVVTSSTGMPAGTFCANCHNSNFTSSRFPTHSSRGDHRVACWNCHAVIPHGTARPGLLVAVDQSTYGDKTTDVAPYRQMPAMAGSGLYIKSYPANNTTNWGQNNCGCGTGGGH